MTKQSGVPEPERSLKPSNDTLRIATALGSSAGSPTTAPSLVTLEAIIRQRALRSAYLPGEVLTDSAWDMLLELLHAELCERRLTASILCKAAGVSVSTGLRWIEVLVTKGLCTRTAGVNDIDRTFVQLSEQGSEAMRGYLIELVRTSDIPENLFD